MASTSVSSSVIPQKEKYDVFISFRGKDTRKTFTSHLHAALIRRKVETYIDYRLEKGDEVGPALLKAIKESKISVIIFSENYADSSWCLDELAYILICKKRHGQHVIPIFYETDPSHVRYQIESYKTAFVKHEHRFMDDPDKVAKWKDALVHAANLSGFDSTSKTVRDDNDLVEQVVEDVLAKLNRESSMDLTSLIGAESRIQDILLELDIIPDDVRVRSVVLWGMGGIGKTTLADAVFHGLSSQFEAHCFLSNVRERSGSKGGFPPQLYDLRNELLQVLLGDKSLTIRTRTIDAMYKEKLRRAKVLVVLDDVNNSSQLTFMVREVPFGPGSRIIITTRDIQPVEETLLVENEADHDVKIYEVEELDDVESLQLLHPINLTENSKFSEKVVNYAAGIPLALKCLLALCRKYKTNEKLELLWDQLKKVSDYRLQKVYRVSYDGLTPNEQEIFLDIACFHKWEELCDAKTILDACGLFPEYGIKTLIDMSLISIEDDCIWMHDVIQEMAWEIVREESPQNPEERSRLHNVEDVRRVLKGNKGTAKIQSISCGFHFDWLKLDPQAFIRMDNLRFLIILRHMDNEGMANLEYLPDALRYLNWHGYPLQSLPSNFSPTNLVELHMPQSKLKRLWGNSQNPRKLRRIDMGYSVHLVEVPDLSESVNIEWINLEGCSNLVQVPSYVQNFTKLTHLNLRRCSKLSILPDLPGNLEFLDLSETAIEELPPSVWSLEKLLKLNLEKCSSIKNFPSSPWKLKSINYLDLSGTKIERVHLSSFLYMTEIISLDLSNCDHFVSLPTDICKLKFLVLLNLSRCYSFTTFPEIAEPMEDLHYLYLTYTKIEELPSSFGNLVGLKELELNGCPNLVKLPSSFGNLVELKKLKLYYCPNLVKLPSSFGNLVGLEKLDFSNCTRLKELPSSIGNLVGLKELKLFNCTSLEDLPIAICKLKSLVTLDLSKCSSFINFPEIAEPMGQLRYLDLSKTKIKVMPSSFGNLVGLNKLDLSFCTSLEVLPNSFCNLNFLESLLLIGCVKLKELPPSFTLCSLEYLDLRGCELFEGIPDSTSFPTLKCLDLSRTMIEKIPPNIKEASGLRTLRVKECKRLQSLPELPCLLQQFNATGCTRLETLANSMTAHTQGLDQMLPLKYSLFGGCVKLDSFSRSRIMDDALRMVTAVRHSIDLQRPTTEVVVTCPGHEIPKWFTCRKEGSSLNLELPQNWCEDGKFWGIALSSVSASNVQCDRQCEILFKTNNGETTGSFTLPTPFFMNYGAHSVETDHVVVSCHVFHDIPYEAEGSLEASFHFYTSDIYGGRLNNVKRCGVCFMYAHGEAALKSSP